MAPAASGATCGTGQGLRLANTSYVDTGLKRLGTVGLFAAAGEQWTVAVRFRIPNTAVTSALMARASSTIINRTFHIEFNRPAASTRTPDFFIRGSVTQSNLQLDDGEWHTLYVVWNGITAIAYYDNARGALTLNVGTAVEETGENLLLGARTTGAPAGKFDGDMDFVAILDVPLDPAGIIRWNQDLYAPWRPHRRRYAKATIVPTAPIIYAKPPALNVSHLELWTDVEANGGVRLGPITQYLSLNESRNLSGEHNLAFSVAMDHPIVHLAETDPALPNLRINQVVRLVMNDGTWSEHRISETTKSRQGGSRTRSIVAQEHHPGSSCAAR